ncbi:MAG: cyanophycinase [Candidatus Thermoplasmatota archaeon]|nr:cyanophycinase [Candidatus Thermoplasmatota archaeon]MBU4071863.1 cyanophycinase [Candidatus Thermoplasmatota archaeon]MBU4144018.1 cyanophycinase [Candidatus Thermoplasmatota archaeon]MBU4591868.1 cyanophycinase [Candidatus Thermoplasmatota archaeon]
MKNTRTDMSGNRHEAPEGILVAVGGNEDKENDLDVLRKITELTNKDDPIIEIITTATSTPKKTGEAYFNAFTKIGLTNVNLLHIRTRDDANNNEYADRLRKADIVYFTGGDQLKITSILGGTPILEEVRRKYFNDKCVIAGTSAGATAMPDTMIYGGESHESLCKGAVQMTGGVGLVSRMVIDSHFIKRGRFSRLMEIVSSNPGYIGLGLGEDTGVIIRDGHILEAIGTGLVVIFDGHGIKYSNIFSLKDGEAIAVEGVLVHTLVNGHGFDTLTREYMKPLDLKKSLRSNK